MSTQAATAAAEEGEIIAQTGTKTPTERGLFIPQASSSPSVTWSEIFNAIASRGAVIGPNIARFVLPKQVKPKMKPQAKNDLYICFLESFPGKKAPSIHFPSGNPGDTRLVEFENPAGNVKALDISDASVRDKWTACGHALGPATLLGAQVPEDLVPIRFNDVRVKDKTSLFKRLPQFIDEFLMTDPAILAIVVQDVWEVQYHHASGLNKEFTEAEMEDRWAFGNAVVVVFKIIIPDTDKISDIVDRWPGWYYMNKALITLSFPGRFNFCALCKHKAQDVAGEFRRHEIEDCIKFVCNFCEKSGHFESNCKAKQSQTDRPDPAQSSGVPPPPQTTQSAGTWGPTQRRHEAVQAAEIGTVTTKEISATTASAAVTAQVTEIETAQTIDAPTTKVQECFIEISDSQTETCRSTQSEIVLPLRAPDADDPNAPRNVLVSTSDGDLSPTASDHDNNSSTQATGLGTPCPVTRISRNAPEPAANPPCKDWSADPSLKAATPSSGTSPPPATSNSQAHPLGGPARSIAARTNPTRQASAGAKALKQVIAKPTDPHKTGQSGLGFFEQRPAEKGTSS